MSIRHSRVMAILAILFADLMLTLNDAFVKLAQGDFSLWAVFWVRALVAVPLLVCLAWRAGLIPKSPALVAIRSILLGSSWVTLYLAFNYMPISTAVAIAYSNPIIIAVMTAILERRVLSINIWIAIVLGFVGALLIVQPKIGGQLWAYALPLSTAVTYAVAMVMTGKRLRGEAPTTLSLWLNVTFMGIGVVGLFMIGERLLPTAQSLLTGMPLPILLMGVIVAFAAIFVAYAFQNAPAPLVGVFDYSYLLFAIVWGFVFFGEMPNGLGVSGIICIAVAGSLTLVPRR